MEGRLQYRTWQAQDGAKRSTVDVVADRVQFLSRGTKPEKQAEEETSSVTIPAETSAEGGWGRAKQLQGESAEAG